MMGRDRGVVVLHDNPYIHLACFSCSQNLPQENQKSEHAMRVRAFISASLLALTTADEPAMPSLVEMIEAIKGGKADNNFHPGAWEGTAGCVLDKVSAIIEEQGASNFANDLLVDLAACCVPADVPDSEVTESLCGPDSGIASQFPTVRVAMPSCRYSSGENSSL